ncbi:uncharacterized protein PHACADRAFT_144871 [Phanerochaete carnosa HHB-10118-sp]|uniref:Uncharacterized protein n=1 Tax=Phanerochaete carnosa (strain HHB-10118-sp) TaxID=650164 RepID=K5VWK8_PHACS|nr:uncharacterized protein PHACADRAFT_144871 [Phanerochaete carnosa HHB-10118-sp]EKM55933.1 hypothetical protein PHACADRAFT_144871 [Phanerochaete carnosa HHB-10118-sp]
MTGSYSPLSREDRIQIEEQIVSYKGEIARLNRRLNADANIMRLPDELLTEIFVHYVCAWQTLPPRNRGHVMQPLGWLQITHICHHWREIALCSSVLWTSISVGNSTELTSTLIERSSQADLHIQGCLTYPELDGFTDGYHEWRPLGQVSHRIRSLRLDIVAETPPFLPANSGIPPLSGLKTLVLDVPLYFRAVQQLPSFLVSDTISLNYLKTHTFAFTAIQPLLSSSLRALSLRRFCMSRTPWGTVFDTLRNLTNLEQLDLEDSFMPLPTNFTELPFIAGRVVTLPSLRSLSLSAEVAAPAGLVLRQLRFPGQATLTIKYGDQFQEDGPTVEFDESQDLACLAIATSLRLSGETATSPPPPILALRLDSGGQMKHLHLNGIPRIVGWPHTIPLDRPISAHTTNPILSIEAGYRFPDLLSQLCITPPLRQVQSLDITSCHVLTSFSDALQKAFAHLPFLSTIRVADNSVLPLLIAMLPGEHNGDGSPIPFPALKTLYIRDFLFLLPDGWDGESDENVCALDLMLSQRALRGRRLDQLFITECSRVLPEDIRRLEVHVGLLTWDGVSYPSDVW